MKKSMYFLLCSLLVALSIHVAAPSEAWARGGHHGHGGHHWHHHGGPHVGFWFGVPFWPRYVYPPYPYPPYPYYRERVVVVEEPAPEVYVERGRAPGPSTWWYYCESEAAYYPDVERCPEPWIKVAPRPD